MTERTTPITLHLTDEQMDEPYGYRELLDGAIKAQRPRPITVGDRVKPPGSGREHFTVESIKDGWAWTWSQGSPWGAYQLSSLTRVDNEATQ